MRSSARACTSSARTSRRAAPSRRAARPTRCSRSARRKRNTASRRTPPAITRRRWRARTLAARERAASEIVAATGATLIHPYNDHAVMAGQATAAVELLGQVPELDLLLCPVGGGGLLAGSAVAATHLKPGIRVVGVEPAGADDAARSFRAGRLLPPERAPVTIADGLRGALGEKPFAAIRGRVEDIVTVTEESIVQAMRQLWEVLKIIIEPSAAVPYAALLTQRDKLRGSHIGVVLSGGNLDLDRLPWQSPPAAG